jgi:hypothetical protein
MVQEKVGIDYRKIVDAIHHYQWCGYELIDVPWFISRQAMEVTAPPGCRYCTSFIGDLVASGEQSFIQMWMDGKFQSGKWQCSTPCFRDEPIIDDIHLNYFFKVELIEVDPDDSQRSIDEMINHALKFFNAYVDPEVVETKIGKDIVSSGGIELGSYGYREFNGMKWVYGTGVAEPRLSHVEVKEVCR